MLPHRLAIFAASRLAPATAGQIALPRSEQAKLQWQMRTPESLVVHSKPYVGKVRMDVKTAEIPITIAGLSYFSPFADFPQGYTLQQVEGQTNNVAD